MEALSESSAALALASPTAAFHDLEGSFRSKLRPGGRGRCPSKPIFFKKNWFRDFPGGAVVKNPPANAGNTDWNPGPGRSHVPRSN